MFVRTGGNIIFGINKFAGLIASLLPETCSAQSEAENNNDCKFHKTAVNTKLLQYNNLPDLWRLTRSQSCSK